MLPVPLLPAAGPFSGCLPLPAASEDSAQEAVGRDDVSVSVDGRVGLHAGDDIARANVRPTSTEERTNRDIALLRRGAYHPPDICDCFQ